MYSKAQHLANMLIVTKRVAKLPLMCQFSIFVGMFSSIKYVNMMVIGAITWKFVIEI